MKKEDYKMEERKEYKKNENYSQEVLAQIMNSYKIAAPTGMMCLRRTCLKNCIILDVPMYTVLCGRLTRQS